MAVNNPSRQSALSSWLQESFHSRYLLFYFLLLLIGINLSGCVTLADPEASQVYSSDIVGMVGNANTVGQSFISRRPDMNAVTLWVSVPVDQNASKSNGSRSSIHASIFTIPGESSPVYTTSIEVPNSGSNIAVTIPLIGLKNSAEQSFYIVISSDNGIFLVNGRNEDAYAQGQAYFNGSPFNADIAFRLSYEYGPAAFLSDLQRFLSYSWVILPLFILLWLPGWLLLDVSKLRTRFDFGEQVAIACGLSLALIPVVMLWTTTLKLHWSQVAIWIISILLSALFILRVVIGLIRKHHDSGFTYNDLDGNQANRKKLITWPLLGEATAIIFIFVVTLVIRLIMIRDLATPAWVDPVHHALITRLIMIEGGYPATYLPYLNISPTDYHPGFHGIAALFSWLSQLDLPRSLLVLGQVINAMCVLSVYLLAKTLTRSPTTGIIAAFIAGFMTPMPAYYTSWGRYTVLTAVVIFPAALAMIQAWMDDKASIKPIWYLLIGALAAAGLFMIHYRVEIFLACLILSFVIFSSIDPNKKTDKKLGHVLLFILLMVGLSILFVLPWIIPTIRNTVLPIISLSEAGTSLPLQDFPWSYLTPALGKQALVLAGLGLIWSIIKRQSAGLLLTVWVLAMFLVANLDTLNLPGSGFISNQSVEIILFIPIAVLGGYFIDQLISIWRDVLPAQLHLPAWFLLVLIFGIIGLTGAKQLVAIMNPVTILSRQADLPAIQWVNEHIPQIETIVINPFAWGYGLYAGNDGGYWIEPLSGRLTITPPVLYGADPGSTKINKQSQDIISLSSDPAAFRDYLNAQDLHYIFVGVRGGAIPPEKLSSSGLFDLQYHQDGAWILKVKP